ncbi:MULTISPECIES: LacI family DNA-binding transcriptional regulator [unclassified Duganella]|jgi:LacI family gluconate utilization system Gnt-I transcriptional repressor|uniref:LacI family DNA-binding transcriptional regulator n=1 Tax=unclassified Duganella TaxID=2636909 RepID=UPI000889A963|nr:MULTISPECIES: LacI family DNA-binding transcriptional regulator [unclassified Duganella]SDH19421.1 transcriptional regulator, LacI family [Duganella sp. OV458]SDK33448.1 transcriptional regulator, LacI family [Duganella sp. OV510]
MSEPTAPRKRRGSGRATIHDVARLAEVGSITVSRYFTEPGRVAAARSARIAAAVKELGYVPNMAASGLASAHGRVVGMVIPNISGPIFANTIQTFSDTLNSHGYQLLLASSYFSAEKEESAVRAFLGWKPAALAVVGRFHNRATEKLLTTAGIPVVETWDYQPKRKPIQVGYSNNAVGEQAARYLYAKGYRRIAFVQNSLAGDLSAVDRSDGYEAVMREHGLQPIIYVPTAEAPFDAGKQAIEALALVPPKRSKPVEAIVFANDNLAAGALLAGHRAGLKIPQQCAIVGFGDYAFSQLLLPSLTTIRPPGREIGEIAALRILEQLGVLPSSGQDTRLNLLACELIERESA